jgi:hypothetical protein
MRTIYYLPIISVVFLIFSSISFFSVAAEPVESETSRADNSPPRLQDLYVYPDDDYMIFEVNYTDLDGDLGNVMLYIDDNSPVKMGSTDFDARTGQYFYYQILQTELDDYTEFYLTADDNQGNIVTFKDPYNEPYLVGDFAGWGDPPELSEPDVYYDGDEKYWVFNVTYWDPDGDVAEGVWLYIDDLPVVVMETMDTDPYEGQEFYAHVLEANVDDTSEFHIDVQDVNGSYSSLYDDNWEYFVVGDFISSDKPPDTNGDDGNGDSDSESSGFSFALPEGYDDPEVIIGIIALIGMAVGSAVGMYIRKRKRKRFSDLLTNIDEVYGSYKMHPRKCERELEKIKSEVDSDLKANVIDENNYTILKDRINEINQEIRAETMRSKVSDLPKDMELRIKDMLIDGKISKSEYSKFMKALKGSTMASKDKKQMEELLETWMKEDKKR